MRFLRLSTLSWLDGRGSLAQESTEKVDKKDVVRCYPIGDKAVPHKMRRVVFTTDEQERARNVGRKPGAFLST